METKSKYPTAYWVEWGQKIITDLQLKQTVKGEYHGSCVNCGGKDRFWIKDYDGKVSVHCRQCNDYQAIQSALKAMHLWPQDETNDYDFHNIKPFKPVKQLVDPSQPYHIRKGIKLYNAVLDNGDVQYKIYNVDGDWVGSQTISPSGKKEFSTGMKIDGVFGWMGDNLEGLVYITEGYADACSVHESTSRPVINGLNSGNIPKVVKAVKDKYPNLTLVLAGDNDAAGLKCAEKAGIPFVVPEEDGFDFNDLHQAKGVKAVAERLKQVKLPKPLWSKIGDLELKEPEWIIDGILEKNALVCGFGAPAAGKTFVMVDMALCVASGTQYHGRDVDGGTVFYIAGEGHNGFVRRCKAWAKHNDTPIDDIPFFKSNRSVVMNDEKTVEQMFNTIKQLSEEFGQPKLVVIDTLNRSMGGDENSTKDMSMFIQSVDKIADEFACTVLVAHHTGHGTKDRARGSSAWLGALDAEFQVQKVGEFDTHIKFTKMKDAPEPKPLAFIKHQVELMTKSMKSVTSLALESVPYNEATKDDPEEIVMETVQHIAEHSGEKWVDQAALKLEIAISKGVTKKTVHNWIAGMVAGNKLSKRIDEKNQSKQWVAIP